MATHDGRSRPNGLRDRESPRAFPLVELLVVIGIVANLVDLSTRAGGETTWAE